MALDVKFERKLSSAAFAHFEGRKFVPKKVEMFAGWCLFDLCLPQTFVENKMWATSIYCNVSVFDVADI